MKEEFHYDIEKEGEVEHPCLFSELSEKTSSFSLLSIRYRAFCRYSLSN
jgi:hypothetical protein